MDQSERFDVESLVNELGTAVVGAQMHYYPEVGSTMDEARKLARSGAPEGSVVVAEAQTAGRGRLGRHWESPPGGSLLLTVQLKPPMELAGRLTMIACLAVAEAIEDTTGLDPKVKWPNDTLIDGKKVCGILVENETRGGALAFSLVGIGVNVNFDPAELRSVLYPATSLSAELGHPVSRMVLLRSLLRHLDRLYGALRAGRPVHLAWEQRLDTLGRRVRVNLGTVVEEGLAQGVDEDGNLVLRRDDGSLTAILAGDVTLHGEA